MNTGGSAAEIRLFERDELLSALVHEQQEAAAGAGRMAFVAGEAGIGKTSVLRAFAALQGRSTPVYWGACDALQTPRPLGPLHDVAAQAGGALAALLARDAPRLDAFSAFLDFLAVRPMVVVIEDLHWADEATLDLLRYIGRRIGAAHSLLIATYRSDEIGSAHPLRALLGDLATSGIRRHQPGPLSIAAVRELAGETDIDAAELHRITAGNPFFVTEVLAAGDERLPATVRDAVLARAARLRPSARAILDAAAVAGPRIEPWLLQDLVAAEMTATDECLASGVLSVVDGVFVFRHELARQAVLGALSPTQAMSLHRMVLRALRPRHGVDAARLAHHAEAAGDSEAVVEFAVPAAREAAARGAHRQAAQQWERVLRQSLLTDAERAAYLDAYAWECHLSGLLRDAIAARQSAVQLWRRLGATDRQIVSLAELATSFVGAGRNEEGESAVREALDLVPPGAQSPAALSARRWSAYVRMLDRDSAAAIREGTDAMAIAERLGDSDAVVHCLNTIGSSMIGMGHIEEGRERLERSLELARRHSIDTGVVNAFGNLGSACGEAYRFDLAEDYLRHGVEYCAERDLDYYRSYQMSWLALVEMYTGRWSAATATAHAVLGAPRASAIARMMALIALGRVRARRGDPGVSEPLDEARELARQAGTLQRIAPMLTARSEASLLEGRSIDDEAGFAAGLELAMRKQHAWFTAELLYWRAAHDGSLLAEVPPFCVDKPFVLEATGRWRAAADAWRDRRCPYEAARALSAGDEAAQREALETFEALGAAPMVERVRHRLRASGVRGLRRGPRKSTRVHPAGLTTKEVAVLKLLAQGLRNKEIAHRMHRSTRTIDHHVAAIYAKLGAANRAEAVSEAHRLGIVELH